MGSQGQLVTPLEIQSVDLEYSEQFCERTADGMRLANGQPLNVIAIARNACPHLRNTLGLIDVLRGRVGVLNFYCFENDSTDETAAILDEYAAAHDRDTTQVEHASFARPDYRGWEADRTTFLAEYRNRCLDHVASRTAWANAKWTVVLDMDPHGGFLPDGVFNSIGWLNRMSYADAGGMASYSIIRMPGDGDVHWFAHYDAYAARPVAWWRDRRHEIGMAWFQSMVMPIGADPQPMNSAFGGLCVYRTRALLQGRYCGGDCEHVGLHRSMRDRGGWGMYLNPGSVYAAVLG